MLAPQKRKTEQTGHTHTKTRRANFQPPPSKTKQKNLPQIAQFLVIKKVNKRSS